MCIISGGWHDNQALAGVWDGRGRTARWNKKKCDTLWWPRLFFFSWLLFHHFESARHEGSGEKTERRMGPAICINRSWQCYKWFQVGFTIHHKLSPLHVYLTIILLTNIPIVCIRTCKYGILGQEWCRKPIVQFQLRFVTSGRINDRHILFCSKIFCFWAKFINYTVVLSRFLTRVRICSIYLMFDMRYSTLKINIRNAHSLHLNRTNTLRAYYSYTFCMDIVQLFRT